MQISYSAVLVFVMSSSFAIPAPAAEPAAASGPDFSAVDALVQKWVDAKNYPGAGVWVVDRGGNTLHERYWNGYTRETTVMIASSSKWLEAATMMTLVDDGKFDLDRPISTYLPEMTGAVGQNTLRQMYAHTSSLNAVQGVDGDAPIETLPARLAAAAKASDPGVRPGELFSYGGQALAVGFRAIEVNTGDRWLTYFARHVAKPCGMRRTVTGHDLWTYSGIVGGDLFPSGNAADYMNFLRMILADGEFEGRRVLSAKAVREMESDQVGDAAVKQPEYPQRTLGGTHHGVYGLGQWRMVVDDKNVAQVVSSPSFAGFIPWVDRRHDIAAVFVGRATGGIDAFHASAELIALTDQAMRGRETKAAP